MTPQQLRDIADEVLTGRPLHPVPLAALLREAADSIESVTPEDLGMYKVNANDQLCWPWYAFPKPQKFQPVYADRKYWEES